MAESITGRENLIELDEGCEGNSIGSDDFIFQKIGESVPLKPADSEFDLENAPVEALAVSEHFRLVFLAHSEGFYVARTKQIIELAKEIKEKGRGSYCIQELSILDVQIGRISILALSTDSSTLAACVGGEIQFYSVTSLLDKEKAPSFSCSLGESGHVKDLRWSRKKNSFLVLSSHGMLYHGDLGGSLKDVMNTVDAVDWSVQGDYIAVARQNTLSILSYEFKERFHVSLLFQSWDNDPDEKCIIKVDSVKWLRSDSIIIGCFKSTEDGNEEGYLLQVITNNGSEITEASKPLVLSFGELFSCIIDDIVPFGDGPYLYANYLDRWEVMLAANRKNTDQHIVLLGWSHGEKKGRPVAIEFKHDKQVPRIELSESGDDNLIVGFGIDKVSLYEKVKFTRDAEHKELSPYCILLCLTSDGKLVMFHVARISDIAILPVAPSMPSNDVTGGTEDSSALLSSGSLMKDHGDGTVEMDGKLSHMKEQLSDGILQEKALEAPESKVLDSMLRQMSEKVGAYDGIPKENASQVTDPKESLNTSSFAGQMFTVETSESVATTGSAYHDSSSTTATKELKSLRNTHISEADARLNDPLARHKQDQAAAGNLPTDASSTRQQSYKVSFKSNEVGKGLPEMTGSTGFRTISSESQPSGKLSISNDFNASASIQSDGHKGAGVWTGNANYLPANLRVPSIVQSSAKTFSSKASGASPPSSIFSSGKATQSEGQKNAWTGAGRAETATSIHSFPTSSREDSMLGKSLNSKGNHMLNYQKTNRFRGMMESEHESSKSYINVSEMTKELDALLSDIEEEGGFRDACTVLQQNSVLELEEGLENLSERCRVWKNTLNERLSDIQHLRDKTMQVLARKVYIEGIVKQASNNQYWELWNRQKLNPEFALKREQIMRTNQNLLNQIIELQRHFNVLELNKFGDNNKVTMRRTMLNSSSGPSRQIQSVHSLYNTVNSQLAAAEQHSEFLSKQMSMLKIESPPAKKQNVAKELFESIGLTFNGDGFQSPDTKAACTPESIKKLSLSSFSAIKEQSRRNTTSSLRVVEPETARRRRDSLDRSWASFEPQKTTVKRMLLEESSRVNKNKSSFGITNQAFNPQLDDGFSILRQKDHTESSSLQAVTNTQQPALYPSNKGIQGIPSTQASESPSIVPFKWSNDGTGAFESGGSKSPLMQVMQRGSPRPQSSAPTPLPLSAVRNNTKEASFLATRVGPSDSSIIQAVSISETRLQSKTPTPDQTPSRTASTIVFTKNGSPKKTVHVKVKSNELSNLNTRGDVQTKEITGGMKQGTVTPESLLAPERVHTPQFASVPTIPPVNQTSETFQFDPPMSRTKFGETTSTATFSSSLSLSPLASAPPIPFSSSANTVSVSAAALTSPNPVSVAPAFLTAKPFAGQSPSTKASLDTSKAVLSSLSLSSSSLSSSSSSFSSPNPSFSSSGPFSFQWQKQQVPSSIPPLSEDSALQVPSKPKVAVEHSPSSGPAQSTSPAGEVSAGSSSIGQPSSFTTTSAFSIFSAAPNVSLISQPENLSAERALFATSSSTTVEVKNEGTDVTVTQEDEMEEEAPDITTELSVGSLGGFGLGSSPAASALKANPFGVPFGSAATSPTSSPFTLTVPSGELFRPASFSFPSSTPQSLQPMNQGGFSGGFGNMEASPLPTGSGFGQSAQVGAGQQALGSVLGAFGQSRQLGPGLPSGGFSGSGFSASTMAGVPGSGSGSGFAGAGAGGGFARVASGGGAFAGAPSGGFGAFSNPQGSGGFSSFGGSNAMGTGKPPELFTQMRK